MPASEEGEICEASPAAEDSPLAADAGRVPSPPDSDDGEIREPDAPGEGLPDAVRPEAAGGQTAAPSQRADPRVEPLKVALTRRRERFLKRTLAEAGLYAAAGQRRAAPKQGPQAPAALRGRSASPPGGAPRRRGSGPGGTPRQGGCGRAGSTGGRRGPSGGRRSRSPRSWSPPGGRRSAPRAGAAPGRRDRTVWVGCLGALRGRPSVLAQEMTRAVHALPGIREQFADDPVTSVSIDEGNGWAFVELASRELAGALVSVGRLWLSSGGRVSVGWPAAQAQRAPARLASPDPARRQPGAGHAAAPDCGVDLWLGAPPESAIGERLDCEIYMRCAGRLESMPVWYALLELFQSLPAYHLAYGEAELGPVLKLRRSRGFFFALLRDPVLASTAVAVGRMWIAGQNVELGRPRYYVPAGDAPAPSLPMVLPTDVVDGEPPAGAWPPAPAPRAPAPARGEAERTPPPPQAHGPEAPLPEADGGGPAPAGGLTATLWVGNLQPSESEQGARERQLRAHVAGCLPEGQGAQIRKVTMHRSGRCAFLDLNNAEIANKIVAALKGSEFDGATLASRLVQVRRHSPSCDAIGEAQKKTKKRRSSAAPKEEASDAEASPKEEASDADASSAEGEPSTGGGCPPPEAAEEKQEQGAEASPAEDPPLEVQAALSSSSWSPEVDDEPAEESRVEARQDEPMEVEVEVEARQEPAPAAEPEVAEWPGGAAPQEASPLVEPGAAGGTGEGEPTEEAAPHADLEAAGATAAEAAALADAYVLAEV